MTYTCLWCDTVHTGEPAEQARNGPLCAACVADDRARNARLRKTRKKRKKRGKR